ncbi:MAG: hypothetical protein ACXW17_02060 [Methylomagnum sp.]
MIYHSSLFHGDWLVGLMSKKGSVGMTGNFLVGPRFLSGTGRIETVVDRPINAEVNEWREGSNHVRQINSMAPGNRSGDLAATGGGLVLATAGEATHPPHSQPLATRTTGRG